MKQYYAVIDTNVIVSSMIKPDSVPGTIVSFIEKGILVPLLNADILKEYEDVLAKNKFGFSAHQIRLRMDAMKSHGIILSRTHAQESFPDSSDIVFFEITLSGRSSMDAYLVTGNIRHYPIRSYVVTPRAMLEIIENDSK